MSIKVKERIGQWGMSKLFRKISNTSPCFWQKLVKDFFLEKNITSPRSTEWCFVDLCKNICISKLPVQTGLKNKPFALWKIRKLNFLSLITPRKKFSTAKIWNMMDREPVVAFISKSDKSDQWVPRKLHLKRWNAEGSPWWKKWNHFELSLCEQASLRSPEVIVTWSNSVFYKRRKMSLR